MPDFQPPAAVVGANLIATVTWRTPGRQRWRQRQITTSAINVGGGALCEITKNGNRISLMIPTGDVADGDPPVDIGPADIMRVRWTGGVVGAVCQVTNVIYDEV